LQGYKKYDIAKNRIFAKNIKYKNMVIERVANNAITLSLSRERDVFGVQRLINYARYLEATSRSKAKQEDIDNLADSVNQGWWEHNKNRFLI